MSSAPGGEEEVRRLLAAYQQYQAQADGIMRQLSLTQITAEGLERASAAVDALDRAQVGQEIMVPIGSGSFIHATLASKEKVILNVGAGVHIEKNAAEAREILIARKAEVLEAARKLSEVLWQGRSGDGEDPGRNAGVRRERRGASTQSGEPESCLAASRRSSLDLRRLYPPK